jgi:DNA-binding PadR family transcriptional regulator
LKQAFDQTFGAIWPELNFGQVYTTLARLERDGLVIGEEVAQEHRRDKRVYEVTPAGDEALRDWIDEPQDGPWVKDEFFMKLAMAQLTGLADPIDLIQRQRLRYMQALHDLGGGRGAHPRARDGRIGDDIVAALLMEGAALHLEADLKWLDTCEQAFSTNALRIPALAGRA